MYIRTLFNHFIILGNEYNHYMVILVQNDENEITAAWGTLLKTLKMSVYYNISINFQLMKTFRYF